MNETMHEERKTVATLRDVVKRYGPTLALDHVDFDIGKGEILGLLGPNGAGKTTAIRALSGLIGVDAGSIEVFGYERLDAPDAGYAERLAPFTGNPDSVFVAHAAGQEVFRGRVEELRGVLAAQGLALVEETSFTERGGAPVFIVYRAR